MKFTNWYVGLCFSLSLAFVLLSGRAEGLLPIRALPLFAMLFLLLAAPVLLFVQLVRFSGREFYGGNGVTFWSVSAPVLAGTILIGALFLGDRIDDYAIEASQQRGDQIVKRVSAYYAEQKSCPENLSDIYSMNETPPVPRLRASRYYIRSSRLGHCRVGFDSVLFDTCERTITSSWECHD